MQYTKKIQLDLLIVYTYPKSSQVIMPFLTDKEQQIKNKIPRWVIISERSFKTRVCRNTENQFSIFLKSVE